jgi:lipopolysaccharide cholinephosphotransferase
VSINSTRAVDSAGIAWIQEQIRAMLAELRRISESAAFDYFLAYGTALGAVRDGDLIPWDPDADVLIPLDRYDEILSTLSRDMSDRFEVLRPGDAGYEHLFARLALRGIDHKIIRVDLFPLCRAPKTRIGQRCFTLAQRGLYRAYLLKQVRLSDKTHYTAKKRVVARAARAALLPLPARAIYRLYGRLLRGREIREGARLLTNPQGSYGSREFFDASWFARRVDFVIGGIKHPIPIGFDGWLSQLYGAYSTPIPADRVERELRFITDHYVRPLRAAGLTLKSATE